MQKKELAKLCMRLEGQVRNELNLKESMTDDEIASLADQIIIQESKVTNLSLSEKLYIKEHVFHALRGYDCLEDIMRDDGITDGNIQIEIPLYAVEWLKMGLS